MKFNKYFAGALAAIVLATGTPAVTAMPVMAATTATAATPEQEVVVKKPSKVTVTATENTASVAIKEVKGASGYQVQYSTKKTFSKKTTKTKTSKKAKMKLSNLKEDTTYYIRTRSFKIVNGKKVYSKWVIKKVSTK